MRIGFIYLIIIVFVLLFLFFMVPQKHHIELGISRMSIDTLLVNNSGDIDYSDCIIEINYAYIYSGRGNFPARSLVNISLDNFYYAGSEPSFPLSEDVTFIRLTCEGITDSWTFPT